MIKAEEILYKYLWNMANTDIGKAAIQAMEEYAQQQAAAPLSEEWKEPIYQELNTGGYGISARDAHKLTLFIGRVIEENVVKQLQAENTRLKAYALTLEDRLTQMEAQAAQPAMEDCCVNSCDGFKCESGSIHKVAAQPPAAGEAVALKPSDLIPLPGTWLPKFKEAWYRDNTSLPKKQREEAWKDTERVCGMIYKFQVEAKRQQLSPTTQTKGENQ